MEQFSQRLSQILSHFDLTSSQFADQIGVPRSSLSHIISGRNNPSLDFIIKIRDAYPMINLYWLIYGFEPFLLENSSDIPSRISAEEIGLLSEKNTTQPIQENIITNLADENVDKKSNDSTEVFSPPQEISTSVPDEEKIVILFNDGTFKSYRQR